MGVYTRWTRVQLAFQRKGSHAQNISQDKHVTKQKRKQIWKGGGPTSAKGGHGGGEYKA